MSDHFEQGVEVNINQTSEKPNKQGLAVGIAMKTHTFAFCKVQIKHEDYVKNASFLSVKNWSFTTRK